MRDDALDGLEVGVGRRVAVSENVGRVEDVEALVLHRAEIEVAHGHDLEDVQVVLAPEDVLVPAHGPLEAVHCVGRARRIALFHVDDEADFAARARRERVLQRVELARHQCEEVAGLRVGVAPLGEMPVGTEITGGLRIAVGQQEGEFLRRLDAHRVRAQARQDDPENT